MNINLNGHIRLPVPVIKKKVIGVLRETDENPLKNNGKIITTTNGNNINGYARNTTVINGQGNLVDICKRRMDWTRQWLIKNQFMLAENLLPELKANEIYYFNDYFKMTEKQFRYLVVKLAPIITKKEPQRKKKSFSAEERLAISLKYLATGEFHSCKHYCFKASQNVIQTMITDICLAIYETLHNDYIKSPKTADEWREISQGFTKESKLPNCTGSLIARHILFKRPKQPNVRYNPKHVDDKTMILMAIVDAYMNFIYVDIGQRSFLEDRTIFESSLLKERIESGSLNLPCNDKIPNENKVLPSFFVTTDKMPLKTYLMKQYCHSESLNLYQTGTIKSGSTDSNYDSSDDASTIPEQMHFDSKINFIKDKGDSTLTNLINMFPILMDPFKLDYEMAKKVTLGCITLYNFLRKTNRELGFLNNLTNQDSDNEKTKCFAQIQQQDTSENNDTLAQSQRNFLMFYVSKHLGNIN
ncbi:uncharacterized protein LOC129609123 [Condylostylus longicornis]|uniref:uncharacterized protein LOC129609123 n=1 Tax=Condylostylus longicornis TaxID=2530218 RepID=UPI00244DB7C4|nr:uncharacterized protein LOC129609123 [Condylostylus longicornis]